MMHVFSRRPAPPAPPSPFLDLEVVKPKEQKVVEQLDELYRSPLEKVKEKTPFLE